MTLTRRITGSDWSVWFIRFAEAAVQGAALGVKASGIVGAASLATTEQWSPTPFDITLLGWTALGGLIYGICDHLIKVGLPKGNEADEDSTETKTIQ